MQLLSEWRKRIEYRLSTIRLRETERKGEKTKTGHANHSSGAPQFRKEKCWIHTDSEHPIWRCNTFQSKPVEERINLAKLNQACTLCLEVGHDVSQCKRKFRYMEKDCNERHNNLLHVDPVKGNIYHADEVDTSQIPTILPLQNLWLAASSRGKPIHAVTLWDGGSTLSSISFSAARAMKLRGKPVKL